jgi:hypothetical protein
MKSWKPTYAEGALRRAHDLLKAIEENHPIDSPADCELVDRVREALSNIALAMEASQRAGSSMLKEDRDA